MENVSANTSFIRKARLRYMFCQIFCFLKVSVIYLSKTCTNNVLISTVLAILSFAEWVVIEWARTEDEKVKGLKIIKTTSKFLALFFAVNTWLWFGVHLAQQKYNLVPNDDPPGENQNDGAPVEDQTERAQGELRNEVVVNGSSGDIDIVDIV